MFSFSISTRANIIIRNGKRWEKDEREFRNVRNQTKERGREGGDRRSVMRARRSHVEKVSVRTSVNISLRKQSIEIVEERDDESTRNRTTRKERLNHFNNSKRSKEAHVSRLSLLSRLLSWNMHPRSSVLSFFTVSRRSFSLVAFLLFRLPCDISFDQCRESSFPTV